MQLGDCPSGHRVPGPLINSGFVLHFLSYFSTTTVMFPRLSWIALNILASHLQHQTKSAGKLLYPHLIKVPHRCEVLPDTRDLLPPLEHPLLHSHSQRPPSLFVLPAGKSEICCTRLDTLIFATTTSFQIASIFPRPWRGKNPLLCSVGRTSHHPYSHGMVLLRLNPPHPRRCVHHVSRARPPVRSVVADNKILPHRMEVA